MNRAAPSVLVSAPSAKEVPPARDGLVFGARSSPPAILPFVGPPPSPAMCSQMCPPSSGVFVNRAASPVLVSALSAGEVPSPEAFFLGERSSPRYSSFRGPAPSPAGFPLTKRPPSRGLFRERGDTPCARFSIFRRECAAREGLVFGKRSSPRYSSFCGPAPSPAMCSQANVSLRRGPPRATKVQQLLIFGVPRFFGGAVPGGRQALASTPPCQVVLPDFPRIFGS